MKGMVFVEGGTFVMGQTEENVMLDGTSTKPRAVTVSSFWMDRNEISNVESEYVMIQYQFKTGDNYNGSPI